MVHSMKKTIIIFGDLPIATKVAKLVNLSKDCVLTAVVIGNFSPNNHDPWDDELLSNYARKNNIPILSLKELSSISEKYDYGISCRFSKILKQDIIHKFRYGVINFHGGLLPEYGGLYSAVHTILNKSKIGGGTIHWINEDIDAGDIILRCEFELSDDDTAHSVFQKTQSSLYCGFKNIFSNIINSEIEQKPMEYYIRKGYAQNYFDKNSLDNNRFIESKYAFTEEGIRTIRAFTFSGYKPAYTVVNNKKINLYFNG